MFKTFDRKHILKTIKNTRLIYCNYLIFQAKVELTIDTLNIFTYCASFLHKMEPLKMKINSQYEGNVLYFLFLSTDNARLVVNKINSVNKRHKFSTA